MSKKEVDKRIEKLLGELKGSNYLFASDLPNIDLYMDQVTTFMDEHLDLFRRSDEDKTLTKTMINNYSKSHLLPPTSRKKYSRDHMLLLLMIYYLKPVMSIPDIQAILDPLQKQLGGSKKDGLTLERYYDTLVKTQLSQFDAFSKEMLETIDSARDLFNGPDEGQNETLSVITMIYMLSLQASIQKHIATHLIDEFLKPKAPTKPVEPEVKKRKPPKQ